MNSTRPRIAWLVYSTVLTLGVILGEAVNLRSQAPSAVTLANWVLSLTLLTALWCYSLRRPLGTAKYWRVVFWIVLFANVVMLVPVMLAGPEIALVAGGLTLVIIPAYYAAFRYAYRSPELWSRAISL
jgi:hypothetical protein